MKEIMTKLKVWVFMPCLLLTFSALFGYYRENNLPVQFFVMAVLIYGFYALLIHGLLGYNSVMDRIGDDHNLAERGVLLVMPIVLVDAVDDAMQRRFNVSYQAMIERREAEHKTTTEELQKVIDRLHREQGEVARSMAAEMTKHMDDEVIRLKCDLASADAIIAGRDLQQRRALEAFDRLTDEQKAPLRQVFTDMLNERCAANEATKTFDCPDCD